MRVDMRTRVHSWLRTRRAALIRWVWCALGDVHVIGDCVHLTDRFDRGGDTTLLGPEWDATYQGRYEVNGHGELANILATTDHVVVWNDVRNLTSVTITCKTCQHIVRCAPGTIITHGDSRLCPHLGGPQPAPMPAPGAPTDVAAPSPPRTNH